VAPLAKTAQYSFQLTASTGPDFPPSYVGGGPNGQNIPCSLLKPALPVFLNRAAMARQINLVESARTLRSLRPATLTAAGLPYRRQAGFSPRYSDEDTLAHSNYNSLQVQFEKRFSHGLQFQASYTFSKSLDNASSFETLSIHSISNATYGLSNFDARHRLVFITFGTCHSEV